MSSAFLRIDIPKMQNKNNSKKEPEETIFSQMSGEEVSRIFFGEMQDVQGKAEYEKIKPAKGCAIGVIASLGLWALAAIGGMSLYNILSSKKNESPLAAHESAETKPALESKLLMPAIPVEFNDISFIIDPDHGGVKGENIGTTLLGYNMPERDYVLGISKEIAGLLDAMGYKLTKKTRDANDPNLRLADRLAMFESSKKNAGISLHINGCADPLVRGARIYHNPAGEILAGYISNGLIPIFGYAKPVPNSEFRVLKGINPAVLVELGFGGSNPEDARVLVEKKDEIINAMAYALASYHQNCIAGK